MSGNQWTLGSIVFGPDRKPVPILTSQGGKPYNYEALKALQDEVAALRAQLAAAQAALRGIADAHPTVFAVELRKIARANLTSETP